MVRRDYPLRFECSHPGCKESVNYRYDTRRDLANSFELKNYSGGRWNCLRHKDPNRVLSPNNPEIEQTIVCEQTEHGRYFGGQGLVTGPGFLAYAKDLPAGTRLIISARVELPTKSEDASRKRGE